MYIILENEEIQIKCKEYDIKTLKDMQGNNKKMLDHLKHLLELLQVETTMAIGKNEKIEKMIDSRIHLINYWKLLFNLDTSIMNTLYDNFKIEEIGNNIQAEKQLDYLLNFIFKSVNLEYNNFKKEE